MNQSPPMGRMFRRALSFEPVLITDEEKQRIEKAFIESYKRGESNFLLFPKYVPWRSLNTTGVQFRVRQLQWDCIRFRKGLGELYTPEEQNAHLAKPVTKKDILDGYLRAGHYFNNFKPRV